MEFKSIVRMTFFAGGSTSGSGKERRKRHAGFTKKIALLMKLTTTVLVLVACFHATANGYTQGITISVKDQPLPKVFREIEKQTGYSFLYHTGQINQTKTVTLSVVNETLDKVLQLCLKDQPFDYKIVNSVIVVKPKGVAAINQTTAIEKGKRINISGKVTGEQGEPVIGATIAIKGGDASTTTTTNEKGEFFINDVDEDAVLVITNVSYVQQEIQLRGRVSLDVRMRVNVNNLDEAVVVAYGTTTKRMNTGSVTVVKGADIATLPNRSFDKSLQGLVPGLLITSGTGMPGGGVSNFVLRGIATATSAQAGTTVRNPLIVIDGIPVTQDNNQMYIDSYTIPVDNPMSQINPSDVDNITVLKDAAAIALYGAKASNGVILITTKKGKTGKTLFNFRHQTDIATRLDGKVDLVSFDEYMELLFEAYRNYDAVKYATDQAILQDLRSGSRAKFPTFVNADNDSSFYTPTNWTNELFQKNAATICNEVSISGGNDKSLFYLNFEYLNQDGIVKKSGFDRQSVRFNFENKPTAWLRVGFNTLLSHTNQDYGSSTRSSGVADQPQSPLNPVHLINGDYYYNFFYPYITANPIATRELNIYRNNSFRGLSKFFADVVFFKNFRFSSALGVDYVSTEAKEKDDPRLIDAGTSSLSGGRIEERTTRRTNIINTNIVRFDKQFLGKHMLGVLLGQEAQILNYKTLSVAVTGLTIPYYDQINSPGVTVLRRDGITTKETLLSNFVQTNYAFDNKYFLSGSVRRDGSSRFGEDKRFGTYWSIGGGWDISRESIMKPLHPWISYFKLRGSIGAAGNAGAIDAYTRYDRMTSGTIRGNTAVLPTSSPGNPDVQWEQTLTWDAGLDVNFLKDRINITVDLYNRKTTNLIYLVNLGPISGYNNVLSNIGEMKNYGTEISVFADIIKNKHFSWNINANWSRNQNKLTKAYVSTVTASAGSGISANQVGYNFNSYYLVQWHGVDPDSGFPLWIDSTGKPGSKFSAAKKSFVGKPQPDGFGSVTNTIRFNNLEMSFQLYYQYGFKIYRDFLLIDDGALGYANQSRKALDRWQKPGDIASNPRRVLYNTDGGSTNYSTRNLYDGDLIRLKQISFAYNFDQSFTRKIGLRNLKVYLQGHNVALWTKYPGGDPDNTDVVGYSGYPYPIQRSYSVGINAGF